MTVHIAYLSEETADGPQGIRAVEPAAGSHQAQRGRFVALVDLRGAGENGAQITDRLLSALQRTYYNAKGSQSQVMVEAVRQAQQMLLAENDQTHAAWEAGIVCIGLLPDRIALAGMGDAFAFITSDGGDVHVCPPERLTSQEESNPFALWPVHRQRVSGAAALAAGCGDWFARISPRTIASVVAYVNGETCQEAATWLQEQAHTNLLPGLILAMDAGGSDGGSGGAPTPPPGPPAGERQAPRPRLGALPTAVRSAPPVVSVPAIQHRSAPRTVAEQPPAPAPEQATADVLPEADAPSAESAAAAPEPAAEGADTSEKLQAAGAKVAAATGAVFAGAKAGVGQARDILRQMLPDRDAPSPASSPAPDSGAMVVMTSTAAGSAALTMPGTAPPVAESEPFVPPSRASGGRARMFISLAVVILVLIPAVVAGVLWQNDADNRVEAESLLEIAQVRILSAQDALDQGDDDRARSLLTEARSYVTQSEEMLGRTATSAELLKTIDREQQTVLKIQPLYGLSAPLTTFPVEWEPQQTLVVDQDVFVLETGLGQVVRYRIDPTGELLESDEGQVVLREGATIDGLTVGPLVDIGWMRPIPGYEDKSNLLVLDASNQVFRYNQVDGATVMDFGAERGWASASEVEIYLDRLYVADPETDEIYRYAPGQYTQPGPPWFLPTTQVNLQGLRAMRIDGHIWLLMDDGKVLRYLGGEQVPYSLDDSVARPTDPVDLYVSQQGDNAIYIADAADERILFFEKESGAYLGQFQAAEGRPLRGLRGIFIDEARELIFLLTDEALYQQRLPR
jgi:hypothetical protein